MSDITHQKAIQNANRFIDNAKEFHVARRQRYHFCPPVGWLNDPNGLIQYNGVYQIYYQYNPYSLKWATMHWGHAVSGDLIHWRHMPVALAPSEFYDDYDMGGCFSGSTVEADGCLYAFYTGSAKDGDEVIQSQNLAISRDGVSFSKFDGNPIIPSPPAVGSRDFRDPKVWKHGDVWYMVVASCKDGCGKALLYRSADLKCWSFWKTLAESDGKLGTLWECPDFFELNGIYVLTVSVFGVKNHKTLYFTGSFDYESGNFDWKTVGDIDFGVDFYAPQTFMDKIGRRIIIGWAVRSSLKACDKAYAPTEGAGFCGSMSLPRTIHVCQDGKLCFQPVKEVESLRNGCVNFSGIKVYDTERFSVPISGGVSYELSATFDLRSCTASAFGLALRCSETNQTLVEFDPETHDLIVDRSKSDDFSAGVIRRSIESLHGEKLTVRIFSDEYSIEIFTDNGRTVLSSNIFPSEDCTGLYLYARNGNILCDSLTAWKLDA